MFFCFFSVFGSSYLSLCQETIHVPSNAGKEVYACEFSHCTSLRTVTMDDSIELIGSRAFAGCIALTSVTLSSSLKRIAEGAFANCPITSLELPEGFHTIDTFAFDSMAKLTSLTLPNTLQNVAPSIFGYSPNLSLTQRAVSGVNPRYKVVAHTFLVTETELVASSPAATSSNGLPSAIQIFRNYAFTRTKIGPSFTIPDTVTTLQRHIFHECSLLETVVFGVNVCDVDSIAFSGASSITSFSVPSGNAYFVAHQGAVYNKNMTTMLFYPAMKTQSNVSLPSTIVSFGILAFDGNRYVTNFQLASGSSYVASQNAIYTRDYKKLVRAAPAVTGQFTINPRTVELGDGAFANCLCTSLSFSAGLKFGDSCFMYSKLQSIDLTGTTGSPDAFHGAPLTSLVVPGTWKEIPFRCFGWIHATSIVLQEGIEIINLYGFKSCSNLQSISLPQSLTTIQNYAFQQCIAMTPLILPSKNLSFIGNSAFENCAAITELTIPSCVKRIGEHAFSMCTKLCSITIGNCHTVYPESAFSSLPTSVIFHLVCTPYFTNSCDMQRKPNRLRAFIHPFLYHFV